MSKVCPYCNSDEGYYDKSVARYTQYYDFNNEPTDASDIMHSWGGKVKYCTNCNRRLNLEKLKETTDE